MHETLAAWGVFLMMGWMGWEEFDRELDALFLKDPEDERLCELEWCGQNRKDALVILDRIRRDEALDGEVFGRRVFERLEGIYRSFDRPIEEFYRMAEFARSSLPDALADDPEVFGICCADECGEAQARQIYERAFRRFHPDAPPFFHELEDTKEANMSEMDFHEEYAPTALEGMADYWRKSLKRPFWVLLVLFVVLCTLFGTVYYDLPEDGMDILRSFYSLKSDIFLPAGAEENLTWNDVWKSFGLDTKALERDVKALSRGWSMQPSKLDAVGLFFNNAKACLVGLALGLVPFLFLAIWPLLANAVPVGALIGVMMAEGYPLSTVLAGLLPHGILEIPMLALSFAMGFALCKTLTKRIFRRPDAHPLRAMKYSLMLFALVVMPLLLGAACLEAWVTPEVFLWALGR